MAGLAALRERLARSPHGWGWIAVAAAVLTHLWTLRLPLAVDDIQLVARCGVWLGIEEAPTGEDAPERFAADATILRDYFRPVLWLVVWFVKTCQGEPVGSLAFHAAWLAVHGGATWLLYRCLRDEWGARAAGIAALVFGTLPGTSQAVSWIVAGGDLFVVVFTLLAIRVLQRAGPAPAWRADALAGLCLLAAVLSKESAPALFPAVAVAAWGAGGRGALGWLRLLLVFAAALLATHAARVLHGRPPALDTGDLFPRALLAVRDSSWDALRAFVSVHRGAALDGHAPVFARALSGLGADGARTAEQAAALGFLALPLAVGLAAAGRRARAAILLSLGACAVALLAVAVLFGLFHLSSAAGRNFYSASALLAAAFAPAAAALEVRPRGRLLFGFLLLPHFLLQTDFWVREVSIEWDRGAAVRARVESLEELSRATPREVRFVVVDPDIVELDRPLLAYDVEFVLLPPFSMERRRVAWAASLEDDPRIGERVDVTPPLQILALKDGRFVPAGPPLPATPPVPPEITPVEPQESESRPREAIELRFSAPVPGRAAAGIAFDRLEAAPGAAPRCVWLASGGERAAAIGAIAGAPNDEKWWLEPSIVGVRLENVRAVEGARLLARLPEIELLEPRADSSFVPSEARFVIRGAPPAASYAFVLEFPYATEIGPIVGIAPSSAWREETGGLRSLAVRDLRVLTAVRRRETIDAAPLWAGLLALSADTPRPGNRAVRARVEARAPDGETIEGASPWVRVPFPGPDR